MFGSVGGESKGTRGIRELEDGFREEKGFEGVEGSIMSVGPGPWEVFLSEVDERASDIGVVRDKSSVEISEAQK